ncbi:hypothetical protein XELAEV_18013116mg [Xenopus laevis]|uniref:Uncharacterized protein n=1 Tax=Xenopus laevis TaxID=8355 RepID=A0A974DNY3_XENLA|nr:hypothetical protein XELAEV_18013116mg [Xenopus laevis]
MNLSAQYVPHIKRYTFYDHENVRKIICICTNISPTIAALNSRYTHIYTHTTHWFCNQYTLIINISYLH